MNIKSKSEGIYKIMDFTNLYIDKVLKHSQDKQYRKVQDILKK